MSSKGQRRRTPKARSICVGHGSNDVTTQLFFHACDEVRETEAKSRINYIYTHLTCIK